MKEWMGVGLVVINCLSPYTLTLLRNLKKWRRMSLWISSGKLLKSSSSFTPWVAAQVNLSARLTLLHIYIKKITTSAIFYSKNRITAYYFIETFWYLVQILIKLNANYLYINTSMQTGPHDYDTHTTLQTTFRFSLTNITFSFNCKLIK